MSYEAEAAAIQGLWFSEWGDGSPLVPRTPTQVPTVPFDPPINGAWVSLNILNGEAQQASTGDPGNNFYRHAGVVALQIFAPLDGTPSADRRARKLADEAMAIFRAREVGGLRFNAPWISGNRIDAPWFQLNVNVPFSRDDVF